MKSSTINRLKRISVLAILFLFGQTGFAQGLVSLDGDLNFPVTDELQSSSQTLRLYNPNVYPIEIIGVDRFRIYGNRVFSVSDSVFTVLPSDTFSLTVSFLPEHNIMHDQALVFISASGFGHTAVGLSGQGSYSKAYYASTENKEQEALKTALSTRLAQGYNDLGYTGARDQMYASIDNVNGQVECVYTGRTATFNTRSGANANSFNTEHTFPQGFFNSNVPMRSDIHHLFPTDVTANSRRSNDPFGVVSSATWTQGGSKSGGGKFEPRDVHKGAVARAMMYFVIRYQDYSNHFSGQETILRQWHDAYPPSADDRARNVAIFNLQNNRNPFVDYPQFIERISDIDGTAQATDTYAIYKSDDTIYLAQGNSGLRTFQFVLYGEGSMQGVVDNFTLSDPNLSFKQGNPGTLTIQEGDYQVIEIEFETSQTYNAVLSYDVFGATQNIPINSGPTLNLLTEDPMDLPQFYPNPVAGILHVTNADEINNLSLIAADGRQYQLEINETIDLHQFNPGLYFLSYSLKESNLLYTKQISIR